MQSENWCFDRPNFDIDENGVGVAVYRVNGPDRIYSLVAFSHDLPDDQRSDRVIAEAWDATFALVDGDVDAADIRRLESNVPKQEAGRVSSKELTLSRANRSVRLFEHTVETLAAGNQPDADLIEQTGYLMRTTAVYGSGKFGAADHTSIADRPEFTAPFQAEMLTVYLIRAFSIDLVEHLAACRAPDAARRIAPNLRRRLGIGNSTGLGMAPFLLNHPMLINNWIMARETALARIRSLPEASPKAAARFRTLAIQAAANAHSWISQHPIQQAKIAILRRDLELLNARLAQNCSPTHLPWNELYRWTEDHLSIEGQEQTVALLIDAHGALTDDLAMTMSADEGLGRPIDGAMTITTFKRLLADVYAFALAIDWADQKAVDRVWYVSAEKLEPRLGQRFEEDIVAFEEPLAPACDAIKMYEDLQQWPENQTLAAFLLEHPEHRHIARRVQLTSRLPYAEIRDNTIGNAMLPKDFLRCKLAFFGATRFDPKSDRWVRINMFQGAPFFDELQSAVTDDWMYLTHGAAP
ncbi:hypothetical protein OAN80_02930 [Alphaproteobacteria bacterium]|nr:hypothetical protein [Alphaproteobacteria bacterium]